MHIQNKKIARQLMKDAKQLAEEDESICAINFDLQKILTTPRAEISPLYYMCKLCIWNFTIYYMVKHEGLCNIWNETVGNRGSNEIASFLWRYIKEKSQLGLRKFLLFSNYGGQNRNKMMFSMYI